MTLVNGKKSRSGNINCGVPQGSILGPLLFLLYINDLPNASSFDVRLFADDACLLLDDKNPLFLEQRVNLELTKINNWMKINKLSINYSKTNYIIFTKKLKKQNYNIHIDGNTLEKVTSTKYLGVVISEKLKWTPHIDHITSKISKSSYILCKLRHYVNLDTLKMLYYSLVYPHLIYCISSWGGASNSTLEPLNVLHRKILRIITHSDFKCSAIPLFYNLKILTITDIYNLNLAIQFHNIINNKFTGINNLIALNNSHNYNTRLATSNNFYQSFSRTNLGLSTHTSAGIKFWRTIPNDLKSSNLSTFKFKLKKLLIDKYNQL